MTEHQTQRFPWAALPRSPKYPLWFPSSLSLDLGVPFRGPSPHQVTSGKGLLSAGYQTDSFWMLKNLLIMTVGYHGRQCKQESKEVGAAEYPLHCSLWGATCCFPWGLPLLEDGVLLRNNTQCACQPMEFSHFTLKAIFLASNARVLFWPSCWNVLLSE